MRTFVRKIQENQPRNIERLGRKDSKTSAGLETNAPIQARMPTTPITVNRNENRGYAHPSPWTIYANPKNLLGRYPRIID